MLRKRKHLESLATYICAFLVADASFTLLNQLVKLGESENGFKEDAISLSPAFIGLGVSLAQVDWIRLNNIARIKWLVCFTPALSLLAVFFLLLINQSISLSARFWLVTAIATLGLWALRTYLAEELKSLSAAIYFVFLGPTLLAYAYLCS